MLQGVHRAHLGGEKDPKAPIYYLYDGQGSIIESFKAGMLANTLRYDAYDRSVQGASKKGLISATMGRSNTMHPEFSYLRARFYDHSQGRFTTWDMYLGNLTEDLSQNRYTYCEVRGRTPPVEDTVRQIPSP